MQLRQGFLAGMKATVIYVAAAIKAWLNIIVKQVQ